MRDEDGRRNVTLVRLEASEEAPGIALRSKQKGGRGVNITSRRPFPREENPGRKKGRKTLNQEFLVPRLHEGC